ncbi:MAG: DNA polymerase III subunit delta [Acidobacteriaceae bacterium]
MAEPKKTAKPQSQFYIFLGEDDFSLRRKIDRWKEEFKKKFSADAVVVIDGSELSESEIVSKLKAASSPSLFSSKKLIIAKDCFPTKASQEQLGETVLALARENNKDNFYVFFSAKRPDRRLSMIKKILQEQVNLTEFELPHGQELNSWIKAYAKQMNATIDDKAADTLAVYLGRDLFEEKKFSGRVVERKEAFDLWQAYSELLKAATYSDHITEEAIKALVSPKVSQNVFDLSDALFEKDRKRALAIAENLFMDRSMDEKAVAIKIVGLLAEQLRSLLLVGSLKAKNLTNQEIAESLGWGSGRVFVLAKKIPQAGLAKIKAMVSRLLAADLALKTSDQNPKLLIEQFLLSTD